MLQLQLIALSLAFLPSTSGKSPPLFHQYSPSMQWDVLLGASKTSLPHDEPALTAQTPLAGQMLASAMKHFIVVAQDA